MHRDFQYQPLFLGRDDMNLKSTQTCFYREQKAAEREIRHGSYEIEI